MLAFDQIAKCAHGLYLARRSREPVRQFSREFPGLAIEDAYAIQREWVRLEQLDGRCVRGYKVGLTARALQQALQAAEPDYGPLLDDMIFESGGEIRAEHFIAPRVEVELAFVLARPLRGPGVTVDDVLRATDYVTPALEIIDARIELFDRETHQPRKLVDVICDLAAAAGVVLGRVQVKSTQLDLRWTGAILYKNEAIEETGLGAAVLGHPAASIAWLANQLAARATGAIGVAGTAGAAGATSATGAVGAAGIAGAIGLQAGDVLLAGSFTKPVAAARGDTLRADYGPLGTLSFKLT
jgi:2-oxo-hept-3-ene-1,7-dioate hydratase